MSEARGVERLSREDLEAVLTRAVRRAIERHRRLGNPICEERDGEVVWIQPEDIPPWDEGDEPGGPAGA